MSRFFASAALVLGFALLSAPAANAQQVVTVPGGTVIKVKPVDEISSANAHPGDIFEVHSVDPVVVDGWIVVPQGSPGQAEVVEAQAAGGHGKPGKLVLKYDWIYSSDGGKIRLSGLNASKTGEGKEGASSTMTVVSTVFLGIPGLFAHNMVKGGNIILDGSQALSCIVDQTVHVDAKERFGSSNGQYDK